MGRRHLRGRLPARPARGRVNPTPAALAAFLSLALKYPGGADRWLMIDPPDAAIGRVFTLYTVGQLLPPLTAAE